MQCSALICRKPPRKRYCTAQKMTGSRHFKSLPNVATVDAYRKTAELLGIEEEWEILDLLMVWDNAEE